MPDDLTIGDLARSTSVAAATLRVWESRFGFPRAERTASGHRRYAPDTVAAVEEVVRRQRAGVRLERAIAETLAAREPAADSVFAALRDRHPDLPVSRLTKATLLALTRAIEDECLASARRGTLFGAFQRSGNFEASRTRWDQLARISTSTYVYADFPSQAPQSPGTPGGMVRVPLPSDAPMRQEWVVVCDAPDLPVVVCAWEPPGRAGIPDPDRVFECLWTLEPDAVRDASRVCASVAETAGAPGAAELSRRLLVEPEGQVDPAAATRLFSRLLDYVGGSAGPGAASA